MSGVSSIAIIHWLATRNGEPATQKQISEALGINQSTVSKIVKSTPGIIANDQVRPTIYTFDPAATLPDMSTNNSPNDTGVIRPDGRILIGNALFEPVRDTLEHLSIAELNDQFLRFVNSIHQQGGMLKFSRSNAEQARDTFDKIAHTIRCRIEKGDFNGSGD